MVISHRKSGLVLHRLFFLSLLFKKTFSLFKSTCFLSTFGSLLHSRVLNILPRSL